MTKVRYRVRAPVFVNGSLVEPGRNGDVIVEAAPGLEGPALERLPDRAVPSAPPQAEPDVPAPPPDDAIEALPVRAGKAGLRK